MPSDLFGICVVGTNGNVFAAGDADHEFTIMSVSKPFVFALVCEALGHDQVREKIGVNATGLAFNSLAAIEQFGGPTNPMVNSGAIATTSLVPGRNAREKWKFIHEGLSRFAGRTLPLNDEVLRLGVGDQLSAIRASPACCRASAESTWIPAEAVDLYTRQCSLNVSAKDLAVMGATLADGGVNPLTKERVVDASVCHYALAVMATAGLYETSGDWLYDIGLPGKSGIGGGIVTVSPGKGGTRHVRPAARRGRQQRQRTTRRQVPVAATGHGPVRFAAPTPEQLPYSKERSDACRERQPKDHVAAAAGPGGAVGQQGSASGRAVLRADRPGDGAVARAATGRRERFATSASIPKPTPPKPSRPRSAACCRPTASASSSRRWCRTSSTSGRWGSSSWP